MKQKKIITKTALAFLALGISYTTIAQTSYGTGAGTGGGASNSYFGGSAGAVNTNIANTFLGYESGKANTTGYSNSFMGVASGKTNTTGYNNTFVGSTAGYSNTTGNENTFVGYVAGTTNTTGFDNTFLGSYSGLLNTSGAKNTFVGKYTGTNNTTGLRNTFIGDHAGYSNTTGSDNTALGNGTIISGTLSNATAIGSGATVALNNAVVLGNNANVGIGLSDPYKRLSIKPANTNDGIQVTQVTGGYAGLELFNQTTGGMNWGLLSLGSGNSQGPGNLLFYNFSHSSSVLCMEGSTEDIAIGGTNPSGYKLYVNGSGYATGSFVDGSDRRFKKDITPVDNALQLVLSLQGVRYNFRNDVYFPKKDGDTTAPIARNFPKGLQVGLIAQDVEKVVPEVVVTDRDGYKGIAYQHLVPLLIEGMKEQQAMLTAKDAKINELEERINRLEANSTTGMNNTNTSGINTTLYQNTPNPFKGYTEIGYKLPQTYSNAVIAVFDMSGKQIKNIALTGKGEGRINVYLADFAAGMYMYSLVVDGQEIATKKMILSAN
jgi:trimeric autotransporter adhesin